MDLEAISGVCGGFVETSDRGEFYCNVGGVLLVLVTISAQRRPAKDPPALRPVAVVGLQPQPSLQKVMFKIVLRISCKVVLFLDEEDLRPATPSWIPESGPLGPLQCLLVVRFSNLDVPWPFRHIGVYPLLEEIRNSKHNLQREKESVENLDRSANSHRYVCH